MIDWTCRQCRQKEGFEHLESCDYGGIVGNCELTPNQKMSLRKIEIVNHPKHYTSHPSGVECITITEHMGFNVGNAIKYLWRADEKGNAIEDLLKAQWYVTRELHKRGHK